MPSRTGDYYNIESTENGLEIKLDKSISEYTKFED